MHARTIIATALGLLLFWQCSKEKHPLPNAWKGSQKHGWVKCDRNGQPWEASALWVPEMSDSTKISLLIGTSIINTTYMDTVPVERLSLLFIPLKTGTYAIKEANNANTGVRGLYYIVDVDAPLARWDIEDIPTSMLHIDAYDSVTQIIKGRFSLYVRGSDTKGWPSLVTFTDAEFEIGKLP